MRIFFSYASQDRAVARAIERNLTEQGHGVSFDRDDLPPREECHARIRRGIDDEASPRREVHVDDFYIDRYEVTTGRYARFLAARGGSAPPEEWEALSLPTGGDLPVVGVDWREASEYCEWAERRLPIDADWEKAARGPDGRRAPWGGGTPTLDGANYENYSPTLQRGRPRRRRYAPLRRQPLRDERPCRERGRMGRRLVLGQLPGERHPGERIAATNRYYASPHQRGGDIGFRCARDVG